MIGQSPAMRDVYAMIARLTDSLATVLVAEQARS
jgi:DNA-binding NtrC family response regulator